MHMQINFLTSIPTLMTGLLKFYIREKYPKTTVKAVGEKPIGPRKNKPTLPRQTPFHQKAGAFKNNISHKKSLSCPFKPQIMLVMLDCLLAFS